MVNKRQDALDSVFHALADSTRRKMLRKLARGDFSVSELAEPHEMSKPAISKHLKVLERAGLIRRLRQGTTHYIQLRTTPLGHASRWLAFYAPGDSWAQHLEALEALVTPE